MRVATILALVPAVLASTVPVDKPWEALKNVPYFPLEAVLPVLSGRAVLNPSSLESRAILEQNGRSQLSIMPHRPHRRDTLSSNNHGLAKRAKGQGKRGQIRSVVRRADACPTNGVSSPATKSTAPTTKSGTTTKGGSTPTTKPTTSKTTTTAKPTSTKGITADKGGNGPFTGWGTWYDVGLGACGWYNKPGDPIVAVSQQLFDNWPGYNGLNPNVNKICGLHLAITWGGKTVIAEVADYCPGCAERSLDMSKGLFEAFADLDVGLLGGDNYTPPITWKWVEGSGSLPALPVSG